MSARTKPIIDAHTHVSLDGRNDKSVANLLAAMDEAYIDTAMVFAATIAKFPTIALLGDIANHRDRLHAIAAVSATMGDHRPELDIMDRWLADGSVRGIKFYTGYEHFYPSDERIRPYLELLVKHKRPAIFHSGDCYCKHPGAKLKYAHPLAVDDLAADMPDLSIIIAHMGSPWVLDCAQVVYKNKSVYADCSGFVYGDFGPRRKALFARLWQEFSDITEGSDKILFGTDWPISNMPSYVATIEELAGDHADAIFHDNAARLFGL